jgi:DNA-binding PadR family transcriptional regulator
MNVSRFVVLGALEELERASGYDVDRYLHDRMIHRWTDIKKASIYHALKALLKAGHVEVVDTVQSGGYPEKTLYSITAEGREAFLEMQREAALGLFPRFYGFKLALKFNRGRAQAQLEEMARDAVARIDQILAQMDRHMESVSGDARQSAFDRIFIEHDRELYLAERAWILRAVQEYASLPPQN